MAGLDFGRLTLTLTAESVAVPIPIKALLHATVHGWTNINSGIYASLRYTTSKFRVAMRT